MVSSIYKETIPSNKAPNVETMANIDQTERLNFSIKLQKKCFEIYLSRVVYIFDNLVIGFDPMYILTDKGFAIVAGWRYQLKNGLQLEKHPLNVVIISQSGGIVYEGIPPIGKRKVSLDKTKLMPRGTNQVINLFKLSEEMLAAGVHFMNKTLSQTLAAQLLGIASMELSLGDMFRFMVPAFLNSSIDYKIGYLANLVLTLLQRQLFVLNEIREPVLLTQLYRNCFYSSVFRFDLKKSYLEHLEVNEKPLVISMDQCLTRANEYSQANTKTFNVGQSSRLKNLISKYAQMVIPISKEISREFVVDFGMTLPEVRAMLVYIILKQVPFDNAMEEYSTTSLEFPFDHGK